MESLKKVLMSYGVNPNESEVFMSWKEASKDWAGGDLAFLSEDGEVISFVVVGDPVLLEGKYKGKPSEKVGCPVVTEDGFQLLVVGKRLFRKIRKREDMFKVAAFIAIRHGDADDVNTRYTLKVLDDVEKTKELFGLVKESVTKNVIADSVKAAIEVMQG